MDFLKVILTSISSAVALFIIAKILGHKQMSQLDFFDYITGITIGSIAAEMATELESPWKPLLAMVVYGLITFLLTLTANKFPKSRKFFNGTPTIIMDNGKLYRKNMKKAKIDLTEFTVMCRQQGFFNLEDIQTAVFEYNGRLSILPKSTKRPLNPCDMNLEPQKELISTEIIMDGKILEENLKRTGLNSVWLEKKLKENGVKNEKCIGLAVCDENNRLSIFKWG